MDVRHNVDGYLWNPNGWTYVHALAADIMDRDWTWTAEGKQKKKDEPNPYRFSLVCKRNRCGMPMLEALKGFIEWLKLLL